MKGLLLFQFSFIPIAGIESPSTYPLIQVIDVGRNVAI